MHRQIEEFHELCGSNRVVPIRLFFRRLSRVRDHMHRGLEQFGDGFDAPLTDERIGRIGPRSNCSVAAEITWLAPHLVRECACVERDHRRIVGEVDSMLDELRDFAASGVADECIVSLASLRFEECYREFRRIDEREAELLLRASGEEIGVGD